MITVYAKFRNIVSLSLSLSLSLSDQTDQGLRCSLTESVETVVVYVDEQEMPSLACTYAHADLDLRWPQNA